MIIQCQKCILWKRKEEFPKRKNRPKGVHSYCKVCFREYAKIWYHENKVKASYSAKKTYYKYREKNLDRARKWKRGNKHRIKQKTEEYYLKNRVQCLLRVWIYSLKNPGKLREYRIFREGNIKRATPLWASRSKIREKYEKAQEMTKNTGIKHHVDHIIPIQNERVCGLHVENNLQVITAFENLKKHNKFNIKDL